MADSLAYALRAPRARKWDTSSYSVAGLYSWLERRAWSRSAAGRAVRDVVGGAEYSGRDLSAYDYTAAQLANRGASILPLLMDDTEEDVDRPVWDAGAATSSFETGCSELREKTGQLNEWGVFER